MNRRTDIWTDQPTNLRTNRLTNGPSHWRSKLEHHDEGRAAAATKNKIVRLSTGAIWHPQIKDYPPLKRNFFCYALSRIAAYPDLFSDASPHLYKRVCPSIRQSVHPTVGDAFVKNKENHHFWVNNCRRRYSRWIWCNHIINDDIIQSFHHHEDASLALWALFIFLWYGY